MTEVISGKIADIRELPDKGQAGLYFITMAGVDHDFGGFGKCPSAIHALWKSDAQVNLAYTYTKQGDREYWNVGNVTKETAKPGPKLKEGV